MDYTEVSSTFVRLADTHFIQRCPTVPESPRDAKAPPPPAPALAIAEKDMYTVPRLSLHGESPPGVSGEPQAATGRDGFRWEIVFWVGREREAETLV